MTWTRIGLSRRRDLFSEPLVHVTTLRDVCLAFDLRVVLLRESVRLLIQDPGGVPLHRQAASTSVSDMRFACSASFVDPLPFVARTAPLALPQTHHPSQILLILDQEFPQPLRCGPDGRMLHHHRNHQRGLAALPIPLRQRQIDPRHIARPLIRPQRAGLRIMLHAGHPVQHRQRLPSQIRIGRAVATIERTRIARKLLRNAGSKGRET